VLSRLLYGEKENIKEKLPSEDESQSRLAIVDNKVSVCVYMYSYGGK